MTDSVFSIHCLWHQRTAIENSTAYFH